MRYLLLFAPLAMSAAIVPLDMSRLMQGPVRVAVTPTTIQLRWDGGAGAQCFAEFSLDDGKPPLTAVTVDGKKLIERASPVYRASTGKRRGGWDQFFDFPPAHPEGTRSFFGEFKATSARLESEGDRVGVSFDGMKLGIFRGRIRYTFYPGSRLIKQEAILSTSEPDTAYFYDAGIKMAAPSDMRPGGNMESRIGYYDTANAFQTTTPPYGSEWHRMTVKYRAVAAESNGGSVAVFPAPHQYFFARDYTTNLGYVWNSSWRGNVSLGIMQHPDDNSPYYPWMNAPPGTEQHMSMFLLLGASGTQTLLNDVRRYTHSDRFPKLDGYVTFTPHWHLAYTVQRMERGPKWAPPFKRVMRDIGLDSAMIMDFHGDGHPADTGETRLQEIDAYYDACRAASDSGYLLIPAEEANVHLGGHWGVVFPHPVYWHMSRKPDIPKQVTDAKRGTVWNTGNADEVWSMVKAEGGYVYQTHPRTKGSTGFPDKIRETAYFRDPRYLGTGWKAMPSDLSSPRLSERSFKILDDMNNWGLKKISMGEADVFQLDSTHELYAHMNVNYVRLPKLPAFGQYGTLLDAVARGDFFTTTGEVVIDSSSTTSSGDAITVKADLSYTFPLHIAEVVWGDGAEVHRQVFPLNSTHELRRESFEWKVEAKGWKWARWAVWDVAGNGAFVNPLHR